MFTTLEPTKKYFLSMFSVSCALLVVFTCVIYRQSEILQTRSESVLRSYDILKWSRLVLVDALNMETSQRGFLLSGVPKFLQPYYAHVDELDWDTEKLEMLLEIDRGHDTHAEDLRGSVAGLKEIIGNHIQRAQRTNNHRLTVKDLEQSRDSMERLRVSLNGIIDSENVLLDERNEAAYEQQKNYQYTLFVGTGLGLGALVVANMLIYALLTRGRQTEAELIKSEERFQLIMNGVNDGIYDLNLQKGTMYHTPSCHRMLGYTEAEYPKTLEAFKELIHPDDLERCVTTFRAHARRETPTYLNEFRLRHKDGSWRWILSRGVGLWDAKGFMYRLVGSQTDITTQRAREEELRQLNSDMEGFTYIASHDLRAPLVNLRGFASEIRLALKEVHPVIKKVQDSLPVDERQMVDTVFQKDVPESLEFIDAAVMRMDKLTSAILDMSRIGRREYRMLEVDAHAVAERCLFTLAHEITSKNITVHCDLLPTIATDALALEQVFGNLLDNAVKYLSPERPGVITIKARSHLDEVIFSIADNGRGIAQAEMRKVFEIFRRANNSGDVRGSGMGMAYVKATLRRLGGRIWFDSVVNQGSVFYFSLPLRTSKELV